MTPHRLNSILASGAGLLVLAGPAMAQDAPPWNEGPGDILLLRDVPHQNAVLVGQPGRPTLVNPRTTVTGVVSSALGAGMFRPLSDLEAEGVRATRTPDAGARGDLTGLMAAEEAGGAAFTGTQAIGTDRTGFIGGAVSGAVGDSTRQLQSILSSALSGGRQ